MINIVAAVDLIIVEVVIIVDGELLQLPELQVGLLHSLGCPALPACRPLSSAPLGLVHHLGLQTRADLSFIMIADNNYTSV